MADDKTPKDEPKDEPTPEADKPEKQADAPTPPDPSKIKDTGMSEEEIRDAGLQIDVPFEAGHAEPKALRYAEGIAEKPWQDEGYLENMPTPQVTPSSELD